MIYENMPRGAQNFPDKSMLAFERGEDLVIRQCSGCGTVQSTSTPVDYYRDVIRATAYSEEMSKFRVQQFNDLSIRYDFDKKKIVEIGCGRGEYLTLMSQVGWDVYGIEHLGSSVDHANNTGLRVEKAYPENAETRLNGAPFDAFVIFNFLEHIPNINDFLSGIRTNLTQDGMGLIEVPNFDMMVRESMSTEFIADHIYYFSEATLKRTLEINGFDVIESRVIWHDYIISAIVRKRDELPFTGFVNHEKQLTNDIKAFLNEAGSERLAVWGAGHQALATITLTGIADRIDYVIDSAPFKQNKYTPASHLPIYAPGILDDDPVDTILIMAAAYSDEVVNQIRNQYGNKFQLAVLLETGLDVLNPRQTKQSR